MTAHAADPIRPNPRLTPGAAFHVTIAQICAPGYATKVRNVPASVNRAVYRLYNITPKPGRYEMDHLISLELGGNNTVSNLWPQSYVTQPYNAHVKDRLEQRLHLLVCHRSLSLRAAQQAISTDWIAAYSKYFMKGVKQ